MADTKITALTAITTVDPAVDVLPIVDISDTTMAASGTTKKITSNQILGAGGTATLASATITGNLTVDTNTLFVDSANNRVGIGTASPAAPVDVQGSSLRLQLQSSSNGGYATWKYIGKNSSGTAVNFEQGLNIAADNAFELYDNQNTQLVSRYVSGVSGAHSWFLTGSTAMTLNSTGLGVGTAPSYNIDVLGATLPTIAVRATSAGASNARLYLECAGTNSGNITYNRSLQALQLGANGPTSGQVTLDSAGQVGIGVTPSATDSTYYQALEIGRVGQGLTGAKSALTGSPNSWFSNNSYATYSAGIVWNYAVSQPAAQYRLVDASHQWYRSTDVTPTAGNAITWTQAMTLDASGNLILQSSATPATLTVNGQLTVNATSNTNLRFSYRGSDGTTRVANITLA
jgi:hypothetical protein